MTLREVADKLAASIPQYVVDQRCGDYVERTANALAVYRAACEAADKARTWQKYAVVDSELGPVCDTEEGAKHAYLNECLGWRHEYGSNRDAAWQRCLDSGGRIVRVTVTEIVK